MSCKNKIKKFGQPFIKTLIKIIFLSNILLAGSYVQAENINNELAKNNLLALDEAIALAINNSPILKQQLSAINSAKEFAKSADSYPDPMLSLMVDEIPVEGEKVWGISNSMQIIGIKQSLQNSATRQARSYLAQALVLESDNNKIWQSVLIKTATAQAWLNKYYLQERKKYWDKLISENKLAQKTTNSIVASGGDVNEGIMPKFDFLEIADALDELTAEEIKANSILKRWLGDDAKRELRPINTNGFQTLAFPISPVEVRKAISEHPQLKLYNNIEKKKLAEIAAEKAMAEPEWNVGLQFKKRPADEINTISLELEISLPLFSSERQEPRIKAAEESLQAILFEKENFAQELMAMTEEKLAMLENINSQINRLLSEVIPLTEKQIKLTTAQYASAKAPIQMLIKSRQQLYKSNIKLINLLNTRDNLCAEIYFTYLDSPK